MPSKFILRKEFQKFSKFHEELNRFFASRPKKIEIQIHRNDVFYFEKTAKGRAIVQQVQILTGIYEELLQMKIEYIRFYAKESSK